MDATHQTDAGREERLARVLDGLLAAARDGSPPDVDAVAAEHPDLADEIRELWATAMIAEDFGSRSDFDESDAVDADEPDEAQQLRETLQPGTRIGDYELLEVVGRGGMGVVYRARQISLDREVALKMLLHGELSSAENVARFRAEAEAAARLNHPHIVPVHEVGEHRGRSFFSLDFVEGTTLAKELAEGPLPPREAARILLAVCEAIAEAHRQGILHRDLKPSNVLLDLQRRPYVTDFGLAKRFAPPGSADESLHRASLTQSGAILGTPGYMAPEQAAGNRGEIGPATDVYSLGAILYACLAGRAPFQAASPVDTVLMVLEQDPLPPRLLNHAADPDLEMIALKCLQKPADLRYGNAAELAADLRAYLAGEPVSARSSRFSDVIVRAFRETHHAPVLENWGLLWMWHSLVLVVLCLVTNAFQWSGVDQRWPYVALWGVGLGVWASFFWSLRRRAGPITFVERQIAHVWAASVACSVLLYVLEGLLGLPVLTLSPVLGLLSGAVFLVKAGILTGAFYVQAAALFATALVMAALPRLGAPNVGLALFGVVSGACFFVPGLKYYRQRRAVNRS